MKNRIFFLTFVIIFSINIKALADSPLTSTHFADAYKDKSIVIEASETGGELTIKLMDYLIKKRNPIAVKVSVINMLGWAFEGKKNSDIFFDYLKKKRRYKDKDDFLASASADELLCMAYMKALDNYFNVDDALIYAEAALKSNPKSYTFNIIAALIKAQKAFDTDWCKVYQLTNNVRTDKNLKNDMNDDAKTIIFEYMDLYKGDCK